MDKPTSFDVERAKTFLKERIVARAIEEQVTLSDAEVATLTYSEPKASERERELADEVEAKVGTDVYEAKIAALVRNAYKDDVGRGVQADWQRHLTALRYEDLYVLVMVRAAGVPGAPSGLAAAITNDSYKAFLTIDTLFLAAVGVAGLVLFFTPLRSLLRTDLTRGAAFVVWLLALWAVGAWSKRRTLRTPR